jgi:signal transduction histidine kinase
MPKSPSLDELLSRLKWFVQLRWLFLLGLAGLLFFATYVFHVSLAFKPVVIIASLVLIYNTGFYCLHHYVREQRGAVAAFRGLRLEANLQIGLDLLALVFLIHYTGGIENPFIFFFIFHMIMGSILLFERDIWFQAAGATSVLLILLILSYYKLIPHYHISGFGSDQIWSNIPYLWAGAVSFSATIFMAVYLTENIARSLRKREKELILIKTQLEKKSHELQMANQELIRKQSLLIQSEKLASLGKLSAGVAHELNNPLTGILNFSNFIKDSCGQIPQVSHDIDVVIRETERCKKIIKGLLDFARQTQPEEKREDILAVLKKTISLVENHRDFRNIEFVKEFAEPLPLIMFDKDQIQQVFMNLIVNAQEAMPQGGKIMISAKQSEDKRFIEIVISDTGSGINEEQIDNIFDPFFTTKEMGTGLGLSISLGIVENHGGRLEVTSTRGQGASFKVMLPVEKEGEYL